jgi:hypothetical protein
MHSRALRILLVVACVCGSVVAAVFIRSLENTLSARGAALRDFDRLVREASDGLADLRAAQPAYLAAGQSTAFWTAKMDATLPKVTAALESLRPWATSAATQSALDQAVTTVAEFINVDVRARGYLKTGAQLMATDLVFTEGVAVAAATRQHIEQARLEEHQEFDRFEAGYRKLEISALGGTAAIVLLTAMLLAIAGLKSRPDKATASTSFNRIAPTVAPPPTTAPFSADDLPLRDGGQPQVSPREVPAQPAELPAHTTAVALQSVAQICTDIARIGDPEELKGLLSRAAEVLDASGLVLWLGTASGSELQPALAHGYSPEMVSRIPMVSRSANNAAAAAYRSGTLQIVLSRSDSPAKGAVVAPVMSAEGCVGVLSAEIRDGGESSERVQSLATIFAAQLAGVVASTPVAGEPRAASSSAT